MATVDVTAGMMCTPWAPSPDEPPVRASPVDAGVRKGSALPLVHTSIHAQHASTQIGGFSKLHFYNATGQVEYLCEQAMKLLENFPKTFAGHEHMFTENHVLVIFFKESTVKAATGNYCIAYPIKHPRNGNHISISNKTDAPMHEDNINERQAATLPETELIFQHTSRRDFTQPPLSLAASYSKVNRCRNRTGEDLHDSTHAVRRL